MNQSYPSIHKNKSGTTWIAPDCLTRFNYFAPPELRLST